jgi:hypothetical protein
MKLSPPPWTTTTMKTMKRWVAMQEEVVKRCLRPAAASEAATATTATSNGKRRFGSQLGLGEKRGCWAPLTNQEVARLVVLVALVLRRRLPFLLLRFLEVLCSNRTKQVGM